MRSPDHYDEAIAQSGVPLQLYWSSRDRIIRDQRLETNELAIAIDRDDEHERLWDFHGEWSHTAEMRWNRRLPRALARFGLLPWRDAPAVPGYAVAARLTSAASRSATRSSADSIPTDRRTRFPGGANGAPAVDACVIRAGCSIRLSTPPSDSASWKIFVRATSSTASCSVSTVNETIPPKSRIWAARDCMAGMRVEPRPEHTLDRVVAVEELRDAPRVLAMRAHPYRKRLQPAQHEPRVERAGHGAERLLQEVEALGERVVVRRDEAADDVAVAAEVLRRRVDDDVGAEVERLLQVRRRERVVDDEQRADGVRRVGGLADVDDVQQRVRRRLDPDEPDVVAEVRGEVVVELGRRHVREAVALRLVHLRRHPVDAAVDVGDQHDALAGVDEVHQRRRRAEARAERDAVLRVLEARERDLQRGARRVPTRA